MAETLLLDKEDIAAMIRECGLERFYALLMERLEQGFRDFAEGRITVPARHAFSFGTGSVESMPAADAAHFAVKVVNTHPANPAQGLPTVLAVGMLVDGATGVPLMITEGTLLTALRTAAASALATNYLARKNAASLGIIGTGAQALPHLHALSLVRDIGQVYAYDIDARAASDFRNTAARLGFSVEIRKPKEVCTADIVVTATTSRTPVVRTAWIHNGTHINAVGGDAPGKTELDRALVARSKLVVDFIGQAVCEGEAQQVGAAGIHADLASILSGKKKGRLSDKEITVFDSVGFALEDLVAYKLAYALACEAGIGRRIALAPLRHPKNRYASLLGALGAEGDSRDR